MPSQLLRSTITSLMLGTALCATPPDEPPPPPPIREHPPGDLGPGQFDRLFGELRDARAELKLSREQDALWQDADKASRAFANASRMARERMMTTLDGEREKEIIDFIKLSRDFEDISTDLMRQRAMVRDKWILLYRGFSHEQKVLVSRRVRERLARIKMLRERGMREAPPRN